MKIARNDTAWFENELVERFTRYVQIHTTSDRQSTTKPSSQRQWDLLNLLASELMDLGLKNVVVDSRGYVLTRIAASPAAAASASIAFLAHVDTSPDAPGEGVKPQVHKNYDGKTLDLSGQILDPAVNPLLKKYVGQTIITSDGTTLLGADDKAGVAEIMTGLVYLLVHPEIEHGEVELIFTTDEEVGRGTENFPFDLVKSKIAYTFDGGEEGTIEDECYTAWYAQVTFLGRSHHPGDARGKLVNAVSMAASFLTMIPRSESPEATDGRFGCLWANDIQGGIEKTTVEVYVRDFDQKDVERRLESLNTYARAVEAAFSGGKVEIITKMQYLNMKQNLDKFPLIVKNLSEAVRRTGVEPVTLSIRGGTDGSRLTEMGLPTPNVFTGGMNYHSRTEWVALPAMVRASQVMIELAQLWASVPFESRGS